MTALIFMILILNCTAYAKPIANVTIKLIAQAQPKRAVNIQSDVPELEPDEFELQDHEMLETFEAKEIPVWQEWLNAIGCKLLAFGINSKRFMVKYGKASVAWLKRKTGLENKNAAEK